MIKKINSIIVNNKFISKQTEIDLKDNVFSELMNIYSIAMRETEKKIKKIKEHANNIYDYELINHITCRLKTPKSIMNKMNKKKYELNYENLINNINDIAGIRIICPLKTDIFKVREIIEKVTDMQIIKEKDYITNPKKSGYSSYHIIVKTPVIYNDEQLFIKVEIQIRTMAMDFWATFEHKTKYKTTKSIPTNVSKKLERYAKMLNNIENKMIKLYENNK